MRLRGVALALVVLGSGVFAGAAPDPASAAPCASTPESIAVIVDFGDGSAVSAVCVPADSSDNGTVVLAARARQLGTPPPRYASSGLLCAIDGYPADGCGDQNGDTYAYWSYWHGTGTAWEYQNIGPASWRVRADVVEGWRFQPHGAGNPSDPPPNGSPDPAATCAPPAPSTTTTEQAAPAPTETGPTAAPAPVSSDPGLSSTTSSTEPTATSASISISTTSTTRAAAGAVRVTLPRHSSSSPWPAVGASAVIVALGASGLAVAHRRRKSS